jgi:hypothetical protein
MRRLLAIGLLAGLAVSCASEQVSPFLVVASSNGSIGLGPQRAMFALVDPEATLTLRDENGSPLATYPMEFVWAVEDTRGLYVARPEIPAAGTYQVTVDAEGFATAGPAGLVAFADSPLVQPGEAAPRSETRTSDQFPDLSIITSDPEPDPALYEKSVAEVVADGGPSVIVFATPAFCTSQTCGPLLDQVKELRPSYPGVDFVHVEVYEDLQVQSFEDLTKVPAVDEWGLPSEPWLFVVDSSGLVSAAFEGAVSDAEFAAAIEAVAP